jgi:hypothetical protein
MRTIIYSFVCAGGRTEIRFRMFCAILRLFSFPNANLAFWENLMSLNLTSFCYLLNIGKQIFARKSGNFFFIVRL